VSCVRTASLRVSYLRRQDIDLVLQRVNTGGWRLIYKVDQRFVKNNWDPENISYVIELFRLPSFTLSSLPRSCLPFWLRFYIRTYILTHCLNFSFGAAGEEHKKFIYNDAAFLFALAIADKSLFGYESLDDLREQEIPSNKNEIKLEYNPEALDRPILRKCTQAGGVLNEPMPKKAFLRIFGSTLKNTGYFCNTSIHAIRRYIGKKVDGKIPTPF